MCIRDRLNIQDFYNKYQKLKSRQKMKEILTESTVNIPENVTIALEKGKTVTVKGPLGTLKRSFKHMSYDAEPIADSKTKKIKKINFQMWFQRRKQRASCNSLATHIKNMIKGVQNGYTYKMKFGWAHFRIQMNVLPKNTAVEIKNFIGQKMTRRVDCLPGCTIHLLEKEANTIIIKGIDVENVSKTAALIHQSLKITDKDKRMFLDGCYVSSRKNEMESEK
eukprot:TRINITY_DN22_c0_g2_i1.p1 TRINITY_DN22_c0_g2~~TRINITY_DN22_c0_g2_i1.p1  ORF type:complete len:222 (-),score=76.03 TRINITY_DN22_c0_g2_i1:113-778(-)